MVKVSSKHIDGSMRAPERDQLMSWLNQVQQTQRMQSADQCTMFERRSGCPSLDSVMFLSARNSQVDVVQSVLVVMRLSPGKNMGISLSLLLYLLM